MTRKEFKLIRLYEGSTQKQHAEKYGLSSGMVAKIEAGWADVSDVTRAKILRKFDISNPSFLEFSKQMELS